MSGGGPPTTVYYGEFDGRLTAAAYVGEHEGRHVLALPGSVEDPAARRVRPAGQDAWSAGDLLVQFHNLDSIQGRRKAPGRNTVYAGWPGNALPRHDDLIATLGSLGTETERPESFHIYTPTPKAAPRGGDDEDAEADAEDGGTEFRPASRLAALSRGEHASPAPRPVTEAPRRNEDAILHALGRIEGRLDAVERRQTQPKAVRPELFGGDPAPMAATAPPPLDALLQQAGAPPRSQLAFGRAGPPSTFSVPQPPMYAPQPQQQQQQLPPMMHYPSSLPPPPQANQTDMLRALLDLAGEGSSVGASAAGARGIAARDRERANFRKHPGNRYRHVMREMQMMVGSGAGSDAAMARMYFQQYVPLQKYKLMLHQLNLMHELHASILANDTERSLGLLAGGYQLAEQYAIDGNVDLGWGFTLLPEIPTGAYVAQAGDSPLARTIEPTVAAATAAAMRDMDGFKKLRAETAPATAPAAGKK